MGRLPHTPKTILLVEDQASFGSFLKQFLLDNTSYQVIVARDSIQALQLAHEIIPDLLILDYHLPHMNGLELYDQLLLKIEPVDIPAILLSATLPKQEIGQRRVMGLQKPVYLDVLLWMIQELVI
jgi:CheY-like chemotaxis protein